MSQYLGDISAYALAVSQGYTGTEEEYAELMASYATVGQTAVTAAQTATTKASEAATSATTATNKASEATTAATTATTKAGEASTSASTATSAKDTAVSASQTATSKATEATTAAATATSAKTDAVAANTAAQSAKTAAQTAQTGAETAAASVQSSAAQIQTNADDISELKEDTTQLKSDLSEIAVTRYGKNLANPDTIIRAYIESNGTLDTTATTYRATDFIPIESGESYALSGRDANNYRMSNRYIGAFYDSSKAFISGSYTNNNQVNQIIVTAPNNATYFRGSVGGNPAKLQVEKGTAVTSFENYSETVVIVADIPDLDALDAAVENQGESIETLESYMIVDKSDNLCNMETCEVGYLNSNGTVTNNDSVEARYKTSDFIEVEESETYTFSIWSNVNTKSTSQRCVLIYYNANKAFIQGTYVNQDATHSVETTAPSTAKYIKVSSNAALMMFNVGSELSGYQYYFSKDTSTLYVQADKIPYINPLYGKKWVVCGDSFTNGATDTVVLDGKYKGQKYTYPWLIGNRNNMDIVNFFGGGRTLAYPASPGTFLNSISNPTRAYYYQNIPEDTDYVTFYLGINDEHHATGGGDGEDPTGYIPLGTIDDNDTTTYYGAWNVVLTWLISNRPNTHIGIIVTNGLSIEGYRTAQIAIARKYGIPFIDMNGDDRTPAMLRTINPDIPSEIKQALIQKWAVDPSTDTHPNDDAQEYESYFIENFLRSL